VVLKKDGESHRVKEDTNILHRIKRRKAFWIGHILRRNCLLKYVIEGNIHERIEVTRRRGRRRKLKEEALYRSVLRAAFGRVYGPVVRQTTE
jgi:hypothetical protein